MEVLLKEFVNYLFDIVNHISNKTSRVLLELDPLRRSYLCMINISV